METPKRQIKRDNEYYMPLILDACCSTKSFWFDKNDNRVLFHDLRNETYNIKPDKSHPKRTLIVKPDVVGDFTKMVFDDNTFQLVVFDPPFIRFGENSVMAKTYGTLKNVNWQDMISKGFDECFRVLKPNGILVFKWDEYEIPIKEILKLTNQKPLFGHISGKRSQTHWVCFMKCDVTLNGI
jgi:SAM-dependent methyltransferase